MPPQESPKGAKSIERETPLAEILQILRDNKCPEVTEDLDETKSTQGPIASGSFGNIYSGPLHNGTKVAIKCTRWNPDERINRKIMKNAARDLYMWSKCDHENVLQLIGFADFRAQLAIISPWMDNGTVMNYLKTHPDADRYQLSLQIAQGLAYLHGLQMVHGDVKGGNVMVSDEGIAKLTDFGNISLREATLHFTSAEAGLPLAVRWAAPELLIEHALHTTRSDVYALGMTILEVMTGKRPFANMREMAVLTGLASGGLSPSQPTDSIPSTTEAGARLWSLLLSCWKLDPSDRISAPGARDILANISSKDIQPPKYNSLPSEGWGHRPPHMDLWEPSLFRAETTASLVHLMSYFTDNSDLQDLTTTLAEANDIILESKWSSSLARTYRATLQDGRNVEIKCVQQWPKDNKKELKFETMTWSKMKHSAIIELIGLAQIDGHLAVVVPWIEGIEYKQAMVETVANPSIDRYSLCSQLIEAIVYLHEQGVVHSNLKAENVLVDQEGKIKLVNFGRSIGHKWPTHLAELVLDVGAARWMAPELLLGDATYSEESDVYALGMTMMEIVSGRIPFSEMESTPNLLLAIVQQKRIPDVPELETESSDEARPAILMAILLQCWAYDSTRRPTAKDLAKFRSWLASG